MGSENPRPGGVEFDAVHPVVNCDGRSYQFQREDDEPLQRVIRAHSEATGRVDDYSIVSKMHSCT